MAKKGTVENNKKRQKLAAQHLEKRKQLRAIAHDRKVSAEDRFAAHMKLAQLPRNSSPKPGPEPLRKSQGVHAVIIASFACVRNQLRELASQGLIPGMVNVELGKENETHVDERSSRRYADTYPQRANAQTA